MRTADRMDTHSEAEEGMYQTEHYAAWLFALVALVLGIIGILRGFGILGDVAEEVGAGGGTTAALTGSAEFWDGIVWMLSAIAFAFLAHAFHTTDPNRMAVSSGSSRSRRESGLMQFELWASYLVGLATIAAAVLTLLVGFGVFSDTHDQFDGMLWGFFAILYGVLTATLHTVRHHQIAAEQDYLVTIVEQRVRSGGATQPGTMRNPEREMRGG